MSDWILIVVVAQFLNAVVAIIDKHIISAGKVSRPIVYAFYVCILSTLSIVVYSLGILPFSLGSVNFPKIENIYTPDLVLIFFSLVAGYAFFAALVTSYSAFQKADASDVIPVVGSVTAIFTFIISFIFLGEVLTHNFTVGFILLVLGMAILSHFRFTLRTFIFTVLSGISFAVYYTTMKLLFNYFAFDQAFFWSRLSMLAAALSFLLIPYTKKLILHGVKKTNVNGGLWVIGNNILGGVAGIAILKASELGSVTIVQSLGSLQFAFLIIISILFGRITPVTFGENNTLADIIQKVISVSLIIIGFYLLFI